MKLPNRDIHVLSWTFSMQYLAFRPRLVVGGSWKKKICLYDPFQVISILRQMVRPGRALSSSVKTEPECRLKSRLEDSIGCCHFSPNGMLIYAILFIAIPSRSLYVPASKLTTGLGLIPSFLLVIPFHMKYLFDDLFNDLKWELGDNRTFAEYLDEFQSCSGRIDCCEGFEACSKTSEVHWYSPLQR